MFTLDIFDTETASLDGGVCDIAIVTVDKDFNVLRQVESLIDPERRITFAAMGIHHITNEMVWESPTLAEFFEMHGNPFKRENPVVAGHNVKFDRRMVEGHLPEDVQSICTLKLARQLYPQADNHQLQTLRYTFGLEAGTSHRAMGDVITTLSLLRHIAAELNTDAIGLLERMPLPISMDNKMAFGKHRGAKLRDVPKSYASWVLNQEDFDADLKEAFEAHFFPGR